MKRFVSIILILLILVLTASTNKGVSAEENEMFPTGNLPSGIFYSDLEETIDTYVKKHESTTAAVSVAVLHAGDILLEKAYGYTDLEHLFPNDENTVFEWGSMTKLLAWVSVMQLEEQGILDLHTDIRNYLPDGFLSKLKFSNKITMLNLMNHNAGWQETSTDLFVENVEDILPLGKALQYIEPEQVYEPGTIVAYSNWGTALAGYIVERVSGQSYADYVHEHIFQPLGMEQTALNPTLSDNPWVAAKRREQKCYTIDNKSLGTSLYYLPLYPAGMATGTLNDIIKFAQALMPSEGEQSPLFGEEQTLEGMLSPTLYYADGVTPRNYHGFWTDMHRNPVIFHNGATLGSSSWFTLDLVSKTAAIIFSNQKGEYIYNCGLLPLIFGDYEVPKESEALSNADIDLSGVYLNSRSILKGYAKPYSFMSYAQFAKDDKGGYQILGSNNTIIANRNNSFVLDQGGIKQFVIYATTTEDGNTLIQFPGQDYMEVNGYGVIAQYVILGLMIIATLYSLVSLIIGCIKLIRGKKYKTRILNLRLIINAFITIVTALYVYITIKMMSLAPIWRDVQWIIIAISVLGIFLVAYILYLLIGWKRFQCTRRERVSIILTAIAAFIIVVNIIFWQSYIFW